VDEAFDEGRPGPTQGCRVDDDDDYMYILVKLTQQIVTDQ
jgi:hypothetical protein